MAAANSSTEHSHHAAALNARWRTNLELHMRMSGVPARKVPACPNSFDTQCHGFSFPQKTARGIARQTPKCAGL
jgi:hypothetical protein